MYSPDKVVHLQQEIPRVLYDLDGVTRQFRMNGVEALRTIPPFYYINDEPVSTNVSAEEVLGDSKVGVSDFDMEFSTETRPIAEVDALFHEFGPLVSNSEQVHTLIQHKELEVADVLCKPSQSQLSNERDFCGKTDTGDILLRRLIAREIG